MAKEQGTIVQVVAVPVDWYEVGSDPEYRRPGVWGIDVVVVRSDATLQQACRWLRAGTRFKLVEVAE